MSRTLDDVKRRFLVLTQTEETISDLPEVNRDNAKGSQWHTCLTRAPPRGAAPDRQTLSVDMSYFSTAAGRTVSRSTKSRHGDEPGCLTRTTSTGGTTNDMVHLYRCTFAQKASG